MITVVFLVSNSYFIGRVQDDYRRHVEFGLLIDPEASISNFDLNSIVHTIRLENPEVGETIVWGVCDHLVIG